MVVSRLSGDGPAMEPSSRAWGSCNKCGECCREIPLSASPDELRQAYNNWNDNTGGNYWNEIHIIYPMLVPLKRSQLGEFGRRLLRNGAKAIYRCKHLVEMADGTGVCSIYEIRPKMCRGYPWYGQEAHELVLPRPCGFWKGVEWALKRKKTVETQAKTIHVSAK